MDTSCHLSIYNAETVYRQISRGTLMKFCSICGAMLLKTKEGDWYCPNHGTILENQDLWNYEPKPNENND